MVDFYLDSELNIKNVCVESMSQKKLSFGFMGQILKKKCKKQFRDILSIIVMFQNLMLNR